MRRNRIVYQRTDPLVGQRFMQKIALSMPHDKKMPGMSATLHDVRQNDVGNPFQRGQIVRCDAAAPHVPLFKSWQFYPQERRRKLVDPRVDAKTLMLIFHRSPIIPERSHFFSNIRLVSDHGPCIGKGSEIFARIETESGGISKTTALDSPINRAMGLSGIFNHFELVFFRNRSNRIHVGRVPIQMNRHNRLCAGSNGRLNLRRVYIVIDGLNVNGDGCCSRITYSKPCGNKGVRRDNDFVAGPDPISPKNKVKRVKSVAAADTIPRAAESGKFSLERLKLFSEKIPSRFHDPMICGVKLGLEFFVRWQQLKKRDIHS